MWVIYGSALAAGAFVALVAGPDDPSTTHPSASLTMTFVVMGLGTVFNAVTNRRDPGSGLSPPVLSAAAISVVPIVLLFLATQLGSLQRALLTQPLTGPQWLMAIGLALVLPVVIEGGKWWRRSRAPEPARLEVARAIARQQEEAA
jgi:Ca2+-transporting ATPase